MDGASLRVVVKSLLLTTGALLCVANLTFASVSFVTPQNGSQVVGATLLEVTTDAANVDRVDFAIDGALAGVARKAPWRIAHDFGESLASHTIEAKVWSNGYRTSETARVLTASLSAGETLNVDLVEVPLRIRTSRTATMTDLRVVENGVAQEIRELRPERGAAQFVFVIDRSLSMGDGKLDAVLRAIDEASHSLRADDTLSVILFNHNVARLRTLTRGERAASLFRDVTPSGGTSLRDAVNAIPNASKRTYAIVITDGGDRNSRLTADEALRTISNTRTLISAIVLGNADSNFLRDAAKNTGGRVVEASRDSVDDALRELIADINSRYLLVYQSHGTKSGWRSIEVASRTRGITVANARKGYFAR